MKYAAPALLLIVLFSCEQAKEREKSKGEDIAASRQEKDSIVADIIKEVMFDTVGMSNAPIKIISAKMVRNEYSNYRNIALSYRNTAAKSITAIRFRWYGINAFGEPADMGVASAISRGFGGGFTERTTKPGKIGSSEWSILSSDGKKVELAWPTEVIFSDGTKWETGTQ